MCNKLVWLVWAAPPGCTVYDFTTFTFAICSSTERAEEIKQEAEDTGAWFSVGIEPWQLDVRIE